MRCENPEDDPYGGLGCNAGGILQTCRFCGFGDFADIECPELADLAEPTLVTYVVTLTAVISETVETFDQAGYTARLALLLNVDARSIRLKIQPASIKVSAEISTTSKSVSDEVTRALSPYRADPAAASKALGVTVESVEPIVVEQLQQAGQTAAGLSGSGSTDNLILGVAVGSGFVLLVVLVAVFSCRQRHQRVRKNLPGSTVIAAHVQDSDGSAEPSVAILPHHPGRGNTDRIDEEDQWVWPSARLTWGEQLGKGSFGSVFVVRSPGLPSMAAKRVDVTLESQTATEKLRRELRREAAFMRSECAPHVAFQNNHHPLMLLIRVLVCGSHLASKHCADHWHRIGQPFLHCFALGGMLNRMSCAPHALFSISDETISCTLHVRSWLTWAHFVRCWIRMATC